MKLKRAVWISVLLYVSTFIVGVLIAVALDTDLSGIESIPVGHWVLSIALSAILSGLFSYWYFNGKKIKAGAKQGLFLGLTFFVVGLVLDAIILLMFFAFVGGGSELLAYYADPFFYISILVIILTPVVVGAKIKR